MYKIDCFRLFIIYASTYPCSENVLQSVVINIATVNLYVFTHTDNNGFNTLKKVIKESLDSLPYGSCMHRLTLALR